MAFSTIQRAFLGGLIPWLFVLDGVVEAPATGDSIRSSAGIDARQAWTPRGSMDHRMHRAGRLKGKEAPAAACHLPATSSRIWVVPLPR
ncbi:hypothetical protein RB213_011346 [Colletotrichum asianum]